MEQKSKIITKNASNNVECKGEKCGGVHLLIDDCHYWFPCVWGTTKDKGSCSIDNDKRLKKPRFVTYCFGCEGVISNIQINPKVFSFYYYHNRTNCFILLLNI